MGFPRSQNLRSRKRRETTPEAVLARPRNRPPCGRVALEAPGCQGESQGLPGPSAVSQEIAWNRYRGERAGFIWEESPREHRARTGGNTWSAQRTRTWSKTSRSARLEASGLSRQRGRPETRDCNGEGVQNVETREGCGRGKSFGGWRRESVDTGEPACRFESGGDSGRTPWSAAG